MKQKLHIRLKAQAMHLALLVGTVVALLLATFILLVHSHSFFKIKTAKVKSLITNVNQQVFKLIKNPQLQIGDTITANNSKGEFKTQLSFYGCWQKLYTKGNHLKSDFVKMSFLGEEATPDTPSLYLKNSNSPLVLVGNTLLKGNVYLPKQGVKAGTISGNYFQNSQLVYGRKNLSSNELPPLDKKWLSYIKGLHTNAMLRQSKIKEIKINNNNSFKEETKLLYQASSIVLGQGQIHGNIIVKSATSITVNRGVSLKDVILIAPTIKIGNAVKGNFQAFAKNSITVGKNCALNFPSSLVVYKKEKIEDKTISKFPIEIGERSKIEGAIVFLREKGKAKKIRRAIQTHLKISEKVTIKGEVYCQGNTELLGTIYGSCYTDRFIANQYGSKYINHIYNGEIKPFDVKSFTGLPFEKKNQKSIAKWLY